MKLRINKIEFFNNKILVSKAGFKVVVNKQVNYTAKPLLKHDKKRKPPIHHEQQQQQKNDGKLSLYERVLAKEHEDKKIAITFLIGIGGYLIWYFLR